MAEKRICGSGGFMGYWGWFSERDLGKYFAYYGKASDCFLVTMKDGRKYMLGCQNPAEMVDAINARLTA
ncbi:PH domain-containing protein [uncultured Duncaniella sp.]|nr:PH domain-containing protein [uncultured Duncaniella sp.]